MDYYYNIRKETLNALNDWLSHVREIAHPDVVSILVGNKSDME